MKKMLMAGLAGMMCAWVTSVCAQDHDHAHHSSKAIETSEAQDPSLPPGEDGARAALESSPRHGEWADVEVPGLEHPMRTWIVYPERSDKAPVVIVICEIYGLTDWIRSVADQLAKEGFIAVAPDMVSGNGPNGGGTESATGRDQVVGWIRTLSGEEVLSRLNAARTYAGGLPAANGKTASIGFCWGGSQSFSYACTHRELDAAVVYYGSSPDSSMLSRIKRTPVLGLYGSDDARVNATIDPAQKIMKAMGKTYEAEIYEGAGHGFLRAQGGREGANLKAAQKAWPRTIEFLRKHMQ